jgi:hypothetical protein
MKFKDTFERFSKSSDVPLAVKALVLLSSSWLFQSILYMDRTERSFKMAFDLIGSILLVVYLVNFVSPFTSILFAWMIVHSLNWIVNGHIPVVMKNLRLMDTDAGRFTELLEYLRQGGENRKSVDAILVYGSLVCEGITETSDIDVRIIRKDGIINGISACLFALRTRAYALATWIPLDIYVFDNRDSLNRMAVEEIPHIVFASERRHQDRENLHMARERR